MTSNFIFQQNTCGYSPYVISILSNDRMGLSFIIAAGPRHPRIYTYFPGTGWLSYTPRRRVPFSSPATTHRATVEVFDPAAWDPRYTALGRTHRKHRFLTFLYCYRGRFTSPLHRNSSCFRIRCRGNMFTKPLLSNGRLFWLHYTGLLASWHSIINKYSS
jgi:hypothetical protein